MYPVVFLHDFPVICFDENVNFAVGGIVEDPPLCADVSSVGRYFDADIGIALGEDAISLNDPFGKERRCKGVGADEEEAIGGDWCLHWLVGKNLAGKGVLPGA